MGSLIPDSSLYASPEVAKSGWTAVKRHPLSATDSYGFALLMTEAFNGCLVSIGFVDQTKNIPPSMQQSHKKLLQQNPKARLSVSHFWEQGKRRGGFFETPLIKLSEGVESLGLKSDGEREELLNELDAASTDFPEEYFKVKLLPELLKSVEFGGGGPKVFAAVMKIGASLSNEEYNARLTPVIVRLFSNPDRAIRVCLLDHLPYMIDHLPQKLVNDNIFPHMVTGFADVAPIVREQTVKAVLTIITKLSDRTINGELLKQLAKTSNDEQADKEKLVRDQGNRTFDVFTQRIRKYANSLVDTTVPPSTATIAHSALPRLGTPQNDTGWAGWAVSSFTNKLATASGDIQANSGPGRPSSIPLKTANGQPAFAAASASQLHRQVVTGPLAPVLTPTTTDQFFGDAQAEDDEVDEAWGDMAGESFLDAPAQQPPAVHSQASAPAAPIDYEGEPDFEGWLKAQSEAKTKAALPKGLSKPSGLANAREAATRSATTSHVVSESDTKKLASTATASRFAAAQSIDTKPKEPSSGDDDWGDAWD
ncbi:MAG: hypothetical protein Q9210_007120 [Variospora velana]